MRGIPCPASTASPGSANPVLHRFCHSTILCRSMVHSLNVRKHVLKARDSLLSTPITKHLSPLGPTTRHVTRNQDQWRGVGTGNHATWDREDCGLWSCNGDSMGTQVQGCQGRGDSRQHRCARRTLSRSPNEAPKQTSRASSSEVFFHVFPSPLDSVSRFKSSVVCFFAVPPTCFPHTWTIIFKLGISPATS